MLQFAVERKTIVREQPSREAGDALSSTELSSDNRECLSTSHSSSKKKTTRVDTLRDD